MTFQVSIPIAGMPLTLICMGDSSIAFQPSQQFSALIDQHTEGISAMFNMEGFTVGSEEYKYGTKIFYKGISDMLQWLKQQNMPMPVFQNSPFGNSPFGF